jgi:tetratricopeptide (TPR) repeat protein
VTVDVSRTPPSPAARRALPSPRRLATVLGVWALVAGGAILVALALDSPVGAGDRDVARPAAPGEVAAPGEAMGPGELPPLALVLDTPPPDGIGQLPPIAQVERLRQLAAGGSPRRLVELGAALQLLQQGDAAREAYEAALRVAPGDVAARVGLAMVEGATGDAGLRRAGAQLERLARERPRDQLVSFNQGWLALYGGLRDTAERAWRRTVALDPTSRLGRIAPVLLRALESMPSGRRP